MANKNQTKKRRVAAARQEERRQTAVSRQARRRQLIVGGVVGFLALALIAPLTAGLISASRDSTPTTTTTTTTVPLPLDLPWVADEFAGAAITGPTPCPADDGSSERTTAFTDPPPICIDPDATFEITFETPAGSFTIPVDASANLDAANLAVALARYRAYEKTPVTAVGSGFLTIGSFGDAGFTIPTTPPTGPLDELYPVGSVVLLADVDNSLSGTLTVVTDDIGTSLMRDRPTHAVIGFIEDMADIRTIYEAPEMQPSVLIDTVTVAATG